MDVPPTSEAVAREPRPAAADRILEACRRTAPPLFFALVLLLGLSVYRDYGISWDEPAQREYGTTIVRYVLGQDQDLLSHPDRYHGPVFPALLAMEEKLLRLEDPGDVYRARHLTTFLVFLLGTVFFYKLCMLRFRDWRVALLGCIFLLLSPRFFGQAFYNCKDIVFMSLFIVSVYTLCRYLEAKRLAWALGHALACAVLVDVRVLGALVPVLTGAWTLADAWENRGGSRRRTLWTLAAFGLALAALVVAFWPTLWADPAARFVEAARTMSRYPWSGTVLYGGRLIEATALPWHYTPVCILITTPVLYSLAFALGLADVLAMRAGGHASAEPAARRLDWIALSWFFLPVLAVIALHSVVYNAWRHSYFVYPAFLLVGLVGITGLVRRLRRIATPTLRWCGLGAAAVLLSGSLAGTAAFIITAHPHQDVYFNFLVGGLPGAKFRYDADYWGLSYRQGLEYIVRHDPSPLVPLYVEARPGWENAVMLDPSERARLAFVKQPELARYFVGAYRRNTEEYPFPGRIFTVDVEGVPILTVFRMEGTPDAGR